MRAGELAELVEVYVTRLYRKTLKVMVEIVSVNEDDSTFPRHFSIPRSADGRNKRDPSIALPSKAILGG